MSYAGEQRCEVRENDTEDRILVKCTINPQSKIRAEGKNTIRLTVRN